METCSKSLAALSKEIKIIIPKNFCQTLLAGNNIFSVVMFVHVVRSRSVYMYSCFKLGLTCFRLHFIDHLWTNHKVIVRDFTRASLDAKINLSSISAQSRCYSSIYNTAFA